MIIVGKKNASPKEENNQKENNLLDKIIDMGENNHFHTFKNVQVSKKHFMNIQVLTQERVDSKMQD